MHFTHLRSRGTSLAALLLILGLAACGTPGSHHVPAHDGNPGPTAMHDSSCNPRTDITGCAL